MNRIRLTVSSGFLMLLLIGMPLTTDAARSRKSRCTDRCADTYHIKKDACRMIPFKTERKICERRAKEAKNDCKHRCR